MKEKRQKKSKILYLVKIVAGITLCAVIVSFICYMLVQNVGDEPYIYMASEINIDGCEKRDAVIVPGAGVFNGLPMAKAKDRLNGAVALYEDGLVEHIIVSGGNSTEIEVMAQYLIDSGIDKEVIAIDEYGTDTYESISRTAEKYDYDSYYFCTQEIYAGRARYLMKQIGLDGQVVCVDTICYIGANRSKIREYFAAVKAIYEPIIYGDKPKVSIEEKDFSEVLVNEETAETEGLEHISIEDIERPKDLVIEDINLNDEYDVNAAVEYAMEYALKANPEYPLFEYNCTNFVSQCLVAGGISQEGTKKVSMRNRYSISKKDKAWFSISEINEKTGCWHYSTSSNFISTDKFIEYFNEDRGYKFSVYTNDYEGKTRCYNEIASGDVLIFYNENQEVDHVGIVTGKGDMNAYYCANTNAKLNHSVFTTNDKLYPQIGVLHMSEKD